jgi:hypothetical protein
MTVECKDSSPTRYSSYRNQRVSTWRQWVLSESQKMLLLARGGVETVFTGIAKVSVTMAVARFPSSGMAAVM